MAVAILIQPFFLNFNERKIMKRSTYLMSCLAVAASAALGSASVAQAEERAAQAAGNDTQRKAENRANGKQQGKTTQAGDTASALLVVLPVVQVADDKLGNGCWVKFYDGVNYKGANLTLVGPVDLPKMDVPGPAWRDWDSAMVGSKATVTTYDNEAYRDRTAVLGAGQKLPDLHDKKLGWFDEVKSVRVSCA